MDDTKLMKDQLIPENKNFSNNLLGKPLPSIVLPNQNGNLLQLKRNDSFRLVIYFYSLTGHPEKKLPKGWDSIPGAKGCTLENCSFRDNYEKLIQLNSIPVGISTQTIEDIKEMTNRLKIQYDILSDSNLDCVKKLLLPTLSVDERIFIKKSTFIVEKNIIKKIFYPIDSVNKHVDNVLEWLKNN